MYRNKLTQLSPNGPITPEPEQIVKSLEARQSIDLDVSILERYILRVREAWERGWNSTSCTNAMTIVD